METLRSALSEGSLLCLDTLVFIYHFEEHPDYLSKTKVIFSAIERGQVKAISSTVAMLEVLVQPLRDGKNDLADNYRKILHYFPNFELIPVNTAIADRAAGLRASYNIGAPDAIHLATAIEAEAECYITNDRKLARVQEIRVLQLQP
ncbi:MAG: type II toxin-antitoxin system VapC family toxin [bacterium]|nr:type II toxin-antitoxin system VapC family toxin [bacterium]